MNDKRYDKRLYLTGTATKSSINLGNIKSSIEELESMAAKTGNVKLIFMVHDLKRQFYTTNLSKKVLRSAEQKCAKLYKQIMEYSH